MFGFHQFTDDVEREAAVYIANELIAVLGEADRNDPDVWELIAKDCGCRIKTYCVPGAAEGQYAPTNVEGIGVVTYNKAIPLEKQARVLCHEIAHHKLHIWRPPKLPSSADIHCYDGDINDARHRIARRVEELIFGLKKQT